jgi:hypothetical protein
MGKAKKNKHTGGNKESLHEYEMEKRFERFCVAQALHVGRIHALRQIKRAEECEKGNSTDAANDVYKALALNLTAIVHLCSKTLYTTNRSDGDIPAADIERPFFC